MPTRPILIFMLLLLPISSWGASLTFNNFTDINNVTIGAGQFESGFSVNGSQIQAPSNTLSGSTTVAESTGIITFTGTWIDLGASTPYSRTIYFIHPVTGVVTDILDFSVSTTGVDGTISGTWTTDAGGPLGPIPGGTPAADIVPADGTPVAFYAAYLGGSAWAGVGITDIAVSSVENSADPVIAGATAPAGRSDFIFTLRNSGAFDVTDVVADFSETITGGTWYSGTGCTYTPSQGGPFTWPTWTVGAIASGASVTIREVCPAPSDSTDGAYRTVTLSLTSLSQGDGNQGDENPANDSSTEDATIAREVDIDIAVSESTVEVVAGSGPDNLVYTVTVTNDGPSDASGVAVDLSTVIPVGVNIVSIDTVDGSESGGLWTIGDLVASDSATLTITITVDLSAEEGTGAVSATAVLSAVNETETNEANNSFTQATDIRWPEATFDVSKIYENGSGPAVDVTLTCSDTTGLLDYAPQQGTTFTSLTVRRFDIYQNSTTCTVTETVPNGFYETDRSADCDVTAVDGAANAAGAGVYDCTITNAPTLATFSVGKIFVPQNPMEIEVFISCNDGLPLNNSQVITEGYPGVTFVVEKFTAGNLDCEITEVPQPTGYDQFYFASLLEGEAGQIDNTDGCQFQDIVSGDFTCAVFNFAQDATFEVNKVWDIVSEGGDLISQDFNLTLSCNQAITAASAGSDFLPGPGSGPGPIFDTSPLVSGNSARIIIKPPTGVRKVTWRGLEGDTSVWVDVSSLDGPARCTAKERVFSDAVEVDNPCSKPQVLTMGQTSSCTITNTVFYEGIPTLSRYGLALLALLMVGVGAVGFRRFS